jgi:hypothetical protein
MLRKLSAVLLHVLIERTEKLSERPNYFSLARWSRKPSPYVLVGVPS